MCEWSLTIPIINVIKSTIFKQSTNATSYTTWASLHVKVLHSLARGMCFAQIWWTISKFQFILMHAWRFYFKLANSWASKITSCPLSGQAQFLLKLWMSSSHIQFILHHARVPPASASATLDHAIAQTHANLCLEKITRIICMWLHVTFLSSLALSFGFLSNMLQNACESYLCWSLTSILSCTTLCC